MALITYEEALARMRAALHPSSRSKVVGAVEARGFALSSEVVSGTPYPRFDNSAVDGYAVPQGARRGDLLWISGAIAAGGNLVDVQAGKCVRVLTGGPIPSSAFAVVMQEDVTPEGASIRLKANPEDGAFIRRKGTEIEVGQLIASAGEEVNWRSVGLFASQGLFTLAVWDKPRIGLLTTGDELVATGDQLGESSIWDATGPMLACRSRQVGGGELLHLRVKDEAELLGNALRTLAAECDIIVVAGGVSVGDRDLLPGMVRSMGEVVFHGVSLRPGKPVLFGSLFGKPIFGLPGNPTSSFVCFELFVREAVRILGGHRKTALQWIPCLYAEAHDPENREAFARVQIDWNGPLPVAKPLPIQDSFSLLAASMAEGLVRLEPNAYLPPMSMAKLTLL